MTNVPEVTDADREAAARCCQARDREEVAEAIARARAEEREACAKVCGDLAAHWRALELQYRDAGKLAHQELACSQRQQAESLAKAIRARGEGGKA